MHEQPVGAKPGMHASPMNSALPAALPVMGILVWPSRISRLLDGQAVPSIELAAEAARQVGVDLYFFRTRDVDLRARRIHGWQQQADGTWEQVEMPWPHVFHPAIEIQKKKSQKIRDAMLKNARLVNSHDVLDKWQVHQALSNFPEMKAYVPETILYSRPSDLQTMISKHGSVLAKPCIGLGAMDISKVWRMGEGLYGWEDSSTGTRVTNLNFQQMLEKVTKNADGAFIVQEELSILETNQQRNKVRVIMNKDGTGNWRHAVTYAFVGKADQFAVSRHQGAEQLTLHQGLKELGIEGEAAETLMFQLAQVSLLTVTCLDQVLGPMGEIGLDLAIGESNKVWLIEANARPNKDNLPFENQWLLMRPFILMMEYARYLWQQGYESDDSAPSPDAPGHQAEAVEIAPEQQGDPRAPGQSYGPIMAILFNRKFIRSLGQSPPREATQYARAARARDILAYFCSADDINLEDRKIIGWGMDADGSWQQSAQPWPDYFYDQGKDMSREERTKADELRKQLPGLVTPINTFRFLDKWFLHRELARYSRVSALLPDTAICNHPGQLDAMLRKHKTVIVKPTNNSRGRGISLVTRTGRRRHKVESANGKVARNLTLQQAFRLILKNAHRNKVLLQRYLHLLDVRGRRFDLRMLMGKDAQGKWLVVSARMRLGRKNSFLTNTNQGADRLPLLDNLRKALGNRDALRLYSKTERLAIGVCRYIERIVGPMGEIGLDFIVDKDRKCWFIEGNPQPGKTPMPHEESADMPLLYSHVMDYCRYLWEQRGR